MRGAGAEEILFAIGKEIGAITGRSFKRIGYMDLVDIDGLKITGQQGVEMILAPAFRIIHDEVETAVGCINRVGKELAILNALCGEKIVEGSTECGIACGVLTGDDDPVLDPDPIAIEGHGEVTDRYPGKAQRGLS